MWQIVNYCRRCQCWVSTNRKAKQQTEKTDETAAPATDAPRPARQFWCFVCDQSSTHWAQFRPLWAEASAHTETFIGCWGSERCSSSGVVSLVGQDSWSTGGNSESSLRWLSGFMTRIQTKADQDPVCFHSQVTSRQGSIDNCSPLVSSWLGGS